MIIEINLLSELYIVYTKCSFAKEVTMKDVLVKIINRSTWWHVPPVDVNAYEKRGKFLASSYLQAEFYGRPNNKPEKVNIRNPVFGFSEPEILVQLFDKTELAATLNVHRELTESNSGGYEKRIELDAKMFVKAKQLGFDSIVLIAEAGKSALAKFRKPNSIELNLISEVAIASTML